MKKILYSILALAFLLVACYREESTEWFNQVNGNHTLKAWIETSANTRTVVNEENQVVWVNGDKIGVYGDQGTVNSPFSFSKISSDGMAEFKGDLKGGETPTAVYYPYDENAAISGDELSLTLPAEYDYSANCNLPMIGVKQEDGTFRFNHLCGLLRISVVGMPKGTTQLKITSKSSDGTLPPSIAGNAVVQDIYESGAKLTMASEQSHEIIITHQADTVSGQTVFLVPMPVGQYPLLSVSLQSEDSLYFEKESTLCNIERATILNMPEISLIPDFQFAADTENNELVLFDYKNNAIVSYALKENGLPERMRVWNAEEGSEEGNWSEISFNEDGTVESIMYDVDHIMVFSNYRKDLVDMAYYADGEITVYKEVVCDDIDWDEYKQKIAEGLADTRGLIDGLNQLVDGLQDFATKYAEEISLGTSTLSCAASVYASAIPQMVVYNCVGAVKDWFIYIGKRVDPEHAEEWERIEDFDDCFALLSSKKALVNGLKKFDSYIDLLEDRNELFKRLRDEIMRVKQMALDELKEEEEETYDGIVGKWIYNFRTEQGGWHVGTGTCIIEFCEDGICFMEQGEYYVDGTWSLDGLKCTVEFIAPAEEDYPFEDRFFFSGTVTSDYMTMSLQASGYVMCYNSTEEKWEREAYTTWLEGRRLDSNQEEATHVTKTIFNHVGQNISYGDERGLFSWSRWKKERETE